MPLPLPNLDTRRWDDLVEEGRALVARYAPAWTDHNLHDPGITLLELLAWLVEQDVYRANRVPERHLRKFLALAGVTPEPPRAARVPLSFTLDPGAVPLVLPAGTAVAGSARTAPPLPFHTARRLRVAQIAVAAVQTWDGASYTDVTRLAREQLPFSAFGDAPAGFGGGDPPALLIGLDRPLPAQAPVSLWVTVAGGANSQAELRALLDELSAAAESCRAARPRRRCDDTTSISAGHGRSPLARPALHLVWELYDGGAWHRVAVRDETRGLTLDGPVRLWGPIPTVPARLGSVPELQHWLRCRVAGGVPDEAPVVLDLAVNAVLGVQRDLLRQQVPLAADEAAALALVRVHEPRRPPDTIVFAGISTGLPKQRLDLPVVPVADGELALWTVDAGDADPWERRPDFDAAGPATRAFVLDPQHGEVRFGDGHHGRVPPAGSFVFVAYATTAAGGGNLDAASTWQLPGSVGLSIAARRAATGGAPAEDVVHASGRAAATLWAHERLLELAPDRGGTLDGLEPVVVRGRPAPPRATTTLDFERLTLAVPGRRVRRARAWAALDGAAPCLLAPGTVTVVVVNGYPATRPQPSASLLAAVRAYLRRRKTLGTRLVVCGPSYVEVTATVRVRPLPGADASALRARVSARLASFLDPLRGGPSGRGWPFGRDVYRTELLALVDGVDGVDSVEALALATGAEDVGCGNVCVGPGDLVVSGAHVVEVVS